MFWVDQTKFHMKKSIVETEITIANRLRFIPITIDTNTGFGIVALV